MAVRQPEQHTEEVSRFPVSTSAEVTIQIAERDGHQVIIIKEQHPVDKASPTEQSIEIPVALLPELRRAVTAIEQNFDENDHDSEEPARRAISFAHESEAEFARILDFYHISWQYEARTFPIEWDEEGNVVKSFTPDFYLVDHDLYIELTTLKQSLVTKKNKKVRRLRELYPEVNVKILYASDYKKLVEKFAASGTWNESQQ